MTFRVHHRRTIRKGRVFDITVENVTFPNGFNVDLEIIRHPGAAAIVALTEDDQVLMLKQYRHAIGDFLWEIPAGTFEGQEDPLICARRELTEETGFTAARWEHLGAVTPVPGYSDEKIHLFLARELAPAAQCLDQDEVLEVHRLPLMQVTDMIGGGHIQDAKTIAAIYLTLNQLKK
ncbi:MAG: NUDIX hydrolase [Desulfobacteraceae bacterium]|nr:MAG: NUDIX hydrolase [Desulfobacteraceae bacterium]